MNRTGEVVEARGEQWIVARSEPYDGCTVLTLEGLGSHAGERLKLIEPFDRIRPVRRHRLRRASRRHVLRVARRAIANSHPAGGLWSAASARIALLSYQMEPALAILGGTTRVLLADAVGLGKTIQAGLILSELRARGLVNRALVVTPAGLRHAWASELRDRFGLPAAIVDQSTIAAQSWLAAADVNPWTCHDIVVASIDFVKRPDVLPSVECAPFDLLIADEVHHLTPGSDRGAAVDRLARRSIWLVLASATPHSGNEPAFSFLRSLGAHGDRLAIFRRTRSDVGLAQSRRSCLLAVTPTTEERALLDAVDRYTMAIWTARGGHEPAIQLVATTLRRRAASSALAVLRTLTRRRALLSGTSDPIESQPLLPWEEHEECDDELDATLRVHGLEDTEEEERCLADLIRLAERASTTPSKIRRIARLVARAHEPIVIFTEFRDTLDALAASLACDRRVDVIHGGVAIEDRRRAIDRFNGGGSDLLIATDAAGEGLNLHHRCRLVITVELPWNPLRLEQRVGRVDRIGQSRRVHAVHLFHRDTVEDTVLARLERRRSQAAIALGEAVSEWPIEHDVAAAVFGELPREPRITPRLPSQRVARAADELTRVRDQRRWGWTPSGRRRIVWAAPRGQQSSAVVALIDTRQGGSNGLTLEHRVEALRIQLGRVPSDRREWRQLVQRLREASTMPGHLHAAVEERARAITAALRPLRESVLTRIDRIRRDLKSARHRQWQASLFDRRVERDEAQRADALDAAERHLTRKRELVAALTPARDECHHRVAALFTPQRNEP